MAWKIGWKIGQEPSTSVGDAAQKLEKDGDRCPGCGRHLAWNVRGSWDALREMHCVCGFSAQWEDKEHQHHPQHPQFGWPVDENGVPIPPPAPEKK